MSESEKKKRLAYRKARNRIIFIQSVLAIIVSIMVGFCAFAFFRADNEYQVAYEESSSSTYVVSYADNDYFEKEEEKGEVYIAALIDSINAKFSYSFELESDSVSYSGNYLIKGELVVLDKNTKKTIITKEETLKNSVAFTKNGKIIEIIDSTQIDYSKYNEYVSELINTYSLKNVECYLNVYLSVTLNGSCADFDNKKLSEHATSIKVPLTKDIVEIAITTSLPYSQNSVVICTREANRNSLKLITIVGAIFDALLIAEIIIFIFATRNYDINYEIKIKRLVSAYKSYIQKILTEFCFDGYQVLKVDTFTELLDIRDTVNLPILMSENADKTCTTFIIPANNKIAYMHEIKVEDYDEIYANKDDTVVYDEPVVEPVVEEAIAEEPVVEPVAEEVVAEEPAEKPVTEEVVAEEPTEEPVAEEAVTVDETEENEETEEETADEVVESEEVDLGNIEITFEPEDMSVIEAEELAAGNGLPSFYNGRRCNYSFEAKLHLANSETRSYYSEIAAFIASYGLKINRSWSKERIQIGKKTYAMFVFKGLKLTVLFALDPAEYENTKYKLKDVSHVKKFSQVPAQMKITSLRKVKWVKELFTQMFTKEGIENKNLPVKVKPIRAKRRSELLKQNLIKIK